ncbi:MAG: hypothetical protein ACRC2V_25760 [Xenococcaceae cyanobacterium]
MSNELTANIYLLLVTYYLLLLPGAALPVARCLFPRPQVVESVLNKGDWQ